jgi:hypothetical protein
MRDENKVLRIEDVVITVYDVIGYHGIHVVDYWAIEDLIARDTKIGAFISCDDDMANLLPFSGPIELLIQVSLLIECRSTDDSCELEVFEPILEGCVRLKL